MRKKRFWRLLDLIHRYEEQRASLNAEIDRVLAEITAKLGGDAQ